MCCVGVVDCGRLDLPRSSLGGGDRQWRAQILERDLYISVFVSSCILLVHLCICMCTCTFSSPRNTDTYHKKIMRRRLGLRAPPERLRRTLRATAGRMPPSSLSLSPLKYWQRGSESSYSSRIPKVSGGYDVGARGGIDPSSECWTNMQIQATTRTCGPTTRQTGTGRRCGGRQRRRWCCRGASQSRQRPWPGRWHGARKITNFQAVYAHGTFPSSR